MKLGSDHWLFLDTKGIWYVSELRLSVAKSVQPSFYRQLEQPLAVSSWMLQPFVPLKRLKLWDRNDFCWEGTHLDPKKCKVFREKVMLLLGQAKIATEIIFQVHLSYILLKCVQRSTLHCYVKLLHLFLLPVGGPNKIFLTNFFGFRCFGFSTSWNSQCMTLRLQPLFWRIWDGYTKRCVQHVYIPSRELTYPPKMAVWRWFSFSPGGIC